MYTITHKQTSASAIVLAVFSISIAAAEDSTSNDSRTASREAPNWAIHTSSPAQRTIFTQRLAPTAIVSPGSAMKQNGNGDPVERSTLATSNRGNGYRRLDDNANPAVVANTPANRNDDAVFGNANGRAKVTWILAKKCGWLCMRVRF